jgi:SAM-dependent methyltransferase
MLEKLSHPHLLQTGALIQGQWLSATDHYPVRNPANGDTLAHVAKAGADYTGIDISKESIKIAKQRFDCYNLNGTLLHMDASDLNLSSFDLVYSFGVIHHYPNIDKILANIHNSLVIDGELRFMVYAKNSWKQSMINAGLDQYEAQNGCPYAQSYTNNEILNLGYFFPNS